MGNLFCELKNKMSHKCEQNAVAIDATERDAIVDETKGLENEQQTIFADCIADDQTQFTTDDIDVTELQTSREDDDLLNDSIKLKKSVKYVPNFWWITIVIIFDDILRQFITDSQTTAIIASLCGFVIYMIPHVRKQRRRMLLLLLPVVLGRVFFFRSGYGYFTKLAGGCVVFAILYCINYLFRKYSVRPQIELSFKYEGYWRYVALFAGTILIYDLDILQKTIESFGIQLNALEYYTINTTVSIAFIMLLLFKTVVGDLL